MLLAIDLGNSNLVAGAMAHGEVLAEIRVPTDRTRAAEYYGDILRAGLRQHEIGPDGVEGAILSSVVPGLTATVARAAELAAGVPPHLLGPDTNVGFPICVPDPSALGSDLIAGAAGVLDRYALPAIVIDMGTATTFSVLDSEGRFQGRSILPGVALSAEALYTHAPHLPRVKSLGQGGPAIGKDTHPALDGGIVYGAAAMLDGMAGRIEAELGRRATLVATGGLAPLIVPHCRREVILEPQLVLHGLERIYHRSAVGV